MSVARWSSRTRAIGIRSTASLVRSEDALEFSFELVVIEFAVDVPRANPILGGGPVVGPLWWTRVVFGG